MVNRNFFLTKLNCLVDVPYDQWHKHGVSLVRVRTNADGKVRSGIAIEANQFIWFRDQSLNNRKLPSTFVLDK
jgi:hypothetical protein